MYKKLANISFWNLVGSLINFLSNFVIVRFFGIKVFGEFSSYSAYISLGALIFIVLPPSYSVFKFQDDKDYKFIFANFFLSSSIVYILFLVALNLLNFISISIFISILYSLSLVWQNYFDVTLQAKNELGKYFIMMTVFAFVKILFILISILLNISFNFSNLLFVIGLSQIFTLFPYFFFERKVIFKSIYFFSKTFKYIKVNFMEFKGYYLNTGLKRIQEYSTILLFTPILSKEVLGYFSLFVKIISFVLGFSRILEMFFNVRDNINKFFLSANSKSNIISLLLQICFIITGLIYLYFLVGQFYLLQLVVLSFLFPLFTKSVFARAYFLSRYENIYLNYSSVFYIIINLIGFAFCDYFVLTSLNSILIVYFLSNSLSSYFLINKFNKSYL
ncbi:hypothetical protein AR687_00610 [Flavobacteriaceae bacterium CRH]|nr:hypothetical protein AR687_00610 [Flavobacteriaceae bacterium CRH]